MFCLYFLLFLTIVSADSDCPGPSFSRIYFQRHYTTFPTEETVQVYLPPYDAQHLTINEVYDGKSDVTTELCLVTEKKFVMRLMDEKNDGWGKGSYITVYTPNSIIFDGLYLASGGFAEVDFIIPPASSTSSEEAVLIFIIVFCFTFLIVVAIVSSIVRCAMEKNKKQMPVTQAPQVTMISGPQMIPTVVPQPLAMSQPQSSMQTPQVMMMQPQLQTSTPQQVMMMQPQLQASTPQQVMMMQSQGSSQPGVPINKSADVDASAVTDGGMSFPQPEVNTQPTDDGMSFPQPTDDGMSFPQPEVNTQPTDDGMSFPQPTDDGMSFPQPEVNTQPQPVNLRQSVTNPALYLVHNKPALSSEQTRISNNMRQDSLSRSTVRFNPKRLSNIV